MEPQKTVKSHNNLEGEKNKNKNENKKNPAAFPIELDQNWYHISILGLLVIEAEVKFLTQWEDWIHCTNKLQPE